MSIQIVPERPEIDLSDFLVQKAKSGELIVDTVPENVSVETQVSIKKMTDNLKAKATTKTRKVDIGYR
jgi:hypothetical protein